MGRKKDAVRKAVDELHPAAGPATEDAEDALLDAYAAGATPADIAVEINRRLPWPPPTSLAL